jgi:putative SOS response-associated peptidase YedK
MMTEPNELMATIHTRMPVILPEAAWPGWLGEVPGDRG